MYDYMMMEFNINGCLCVISWLPFALLTNQHEIDYLFTKIEIFQLVNNKRVNKRAAK